MNPKNFHIGSSSELKTPADAGFVLTWMSPIAMINTSGRNEGRSFHPGASVYVKPDTTIYFRAYNSSSKSWSHPTVSFSGYYLPVREEIPANEVVKALSSVAKDALAEASLGSLVDEVARKLKNRSVENETREFEQALQQAKDEFQAHFDELLRQMKQKEPE